MLFSFTPLTTYDEPQRSWVKFPRCPATVKPGRLCFVRVGSSLPSQFLATFVRKGAGEFRKSTPICISPSRRLWREAFLSP